MERMLLLWIIADLTGCGRELILVIKKFTAPVYIYGEELPARYWHKLVTLSIQSLVLVVFKCK